MSVPSEYHESTNYDESTMRVLSHSQCDGRLALQAVQFAIKPLSLHHRVNACDSTRPLNELRVVRCCANPTQPNPATPPGGDQTLLQYVSLSTLTLTHSLLALSHGPTDAVRWCGG
jgi:hypothetical protein